MRNKETVEHELNEQLTSPSKSEKSQKKMGSLLLGEYDEMELRKVEHKDVIAKLMRELARKYPDPAAREWTEKKYELLINKEKAMLTALRRGEAQEGIKLLYELLALILFANPSDFGEVKLNIIELTVVLSRIEIAPGNYDVFVTEAKNESMRQIYEADTVDELISLIFQSTIRVSNTIAAFRGSPHAAALRKAEAFIAENYTRKLSLTEIAGVAGLSPPYFSTIFKVEMGENLSKYLNRLRVERASDLLLKTDMSLSEIAANCCFEDQSWFSKIFKAFTGISPGKYRNQGGGVISSLVDSNLSQAFRNAMDKKLGY